MFQINNIEAFKCAGVTPPGFKGNLEFLLKSKFFAKFRRRKCPKIYFFHPFLRSSNLTVTLFMILNSARSEVVTRQR